MWNNRDHVHPGRHRLHRRRTDFRANVGIILTHGGRRGISGRPRWAAAGGSFPKAASTAASRWKTRCFASSRRRSGWTVRMSTYLGSYARVAALPPAAAICEGSLHRPETALVSAASSPPMRIEAAFRSHRSRPSSTAGAGPIIGHLFEKSFTSSGACTCGPCMTLGKLIFPDGHAAISGLVGGGGDMTAS